MTALKPLITPQSEVMTTVAGLASIGGQNWDQSYSFTDSLVFQECSELIERPTVGPSSFSFISRLLVSAFSYARQILNSDSTICFEGLFYEAKRYGVIYLSLKTLFLARQPFQQFSRSAASTACALRGFFLNIRSQLGVMISDFANSFSAKRFSITSKSYVSPTKINTNHLGCLAWFWRLRLQLNLNIVFTRLSSYQSATSWLSAFPCKQCPGGS